LTNRFPQGHNVGYYNFIFHISNRSYTAGVGLR